jgi:hypothetical protein
MTHFDTILAAFEERKAVCDSHPVPKGQNSCTCYASSPEGRAFFGYREPVCSICGGGKHCKPWCDAVDRQP